MKIGLVLCFGLITLFSQAQDYKKDFLQVYKSYTTKVYYTQEVTVRSFVKESDRKAAYEEQGKIVKDQERYYSSLGGQTTIVKEGNFLHINKEEKRMLFYHQEEGENRMTEQYQMLLDSIKSTDIEYLGNNKGIKKYLLKTTNQLISSTELSLDMNKNMVSKIVYHYNFKAKYNSSFEKIVIVYKTDYKNKPVSSWFDLDQYIDVKGDRAALKKAYKDYTLTQPEEETRRWEELSK